ncbi:MAG: hypothetical protein J6H21_03865 [Firmicutes bacterium]|nr:hypothetical protein [Bacillota bacterium]
MSKRKENLDPAILNMVTKDNGLGSAMKVALAILGIGVAAGATLVVGMDQIMKRIFVSESWPSKEWGENDWAEEDLE